MRKTAFTLILSAAILLGAPLAATAADESPTPGAGSGEYGPRTPTTPTLAGSSVVPDCSADVPWITYVVKLTDPDDAATGHTARLVLSDGTNSVTLTLGELNEDNSLTGRILWPGASVDANGNGNGWPGWAFVDGEWVETTGNYAWTRGAITARLEVNPELPVSLSYPPSTPQCLTHPPTGLSPDEVLQATGGDAGALLPIAIGAGAAAALGAGLIVVRRRRQAHS